MKTVNGNGEIFHAELGSVSLPISAQRYEQVTNVSKCLYEVVSWEENYDYVIENYKEVEREIFDVTSSFLIHSFSVIQKHHGERSAISRRVANLLSSCKGYVDHTPHHLQLMFGKESKVLEFFKKITSDEYDKNLSYRFMEELRNYAQHRGFPFRGIEYGSHRINAKDKGLFYIVSPLLSLKDLSSDKKFKRSIVDEMLKAGEKVDIRSTIREYLEGLSNVHITMRTKLQNYISSWEETIKSLYIELGATADPIPEHTIILRTKEDQAFEELEYASLSVMKRINDYKDKNKILSNLSNRFISTQIKEFYRGTNK
jgi:hypothetical protein